MKLAKVVNLWKRSSNMISDLSKNYNFKYIHVLQPNQYFKDSKLLTKKEKEISNFTKYSNPISKYYEKFNIDEVQAKYKFDS